MIASLAALSASAALFLRSNSASGTDGDGGLPEGEYFLFERRRSDSIDDEDEYVESNSVSSETPFVSTEDSVTVDDMFSRGFILRVALIDVLLMSSGVGPALEVSSLASVFHCGLNKELNNGLLSLSAELFLLCCCWRCLRSSFSLASLSSYFIMLSRTCAKRSLMVASGLFMVVVLRGVVFRGFTAMIMSEK